MPRFAGPYGGERHMLHYASTLGEWGHEVVIYTHMFSPDCRQLIFSNNVRLIETGFPRVKSHYLQVLFSHLFVLNLAARVRGEFDLIQVWGGEGVLAGALLRRFRRKYAGVSMLLVTGEPPRFAYDLEEESLAGKNMLWKLVLRMGVPVVRYLDKISVRQMDMVVVNNDWVSEQFQDIYARECRIIYPGVETERFKRYSKDEARNILGLNRDLKIFLSVSKLHPRKRIDDAIRVYGEYSAKLESTVFFIIGDGPEENALKELAQRLGMNDVIFLGRLSDEQVAIYNQAADYFIFTAKNEPYGIAPMEAKVAGCQLLPEDKLNPIISWEESAEQIFKLYKDILA